jgi:lipopolysaccharide export system permease protein
MLCSPRRAPAGNCRISELVARIQSLMTTMQRHMARRMLATAGAILLTLSVAGALIEGAPLFALLTIGAITPGKLALGLLLKLQMQLCTCTPLAFGVAVTHSYYEWQRNNEIVPLKTAGASNLWLAVPAIAAALVALLLTAVNTLYLLPISARAFEDLRYNITGAIVPAALDTGYLQKIGPDLSISFRRRLDDRTIEGVIVLDGHTDETLTYIVADRGRFVSEPGKGSGFHIVLEHGYYYRLNSNESHGSPVTFKELVVPISDGAQKKSQSRGWYEQDIVSLFDPPAFIRAVPVEYGFWIAEGTTRLVVPFACLGYALLVTGVMLRAKPVRIGAGLHATLCLCLVAAWHALFTLLQSLIAADPMFAPVDCLAVLIPVALGFSLIVLPPRPARRVGAQAAFWHPMPEPTVRTPPRA